MSDYRALEVKVAFS